MLSKKDHGSTLAARHERGAYFTPEPVARFISDWALGERGNRVLEPSSGEAQFLLSAARTLSAQGRQHAELHGIELHGPSVQAARERLAAESVNGTIRQANFFEVPATGDYDAVIGNPPYVRYQLHRGAERELSRAAAAKAGVELSELASTWAAFTAHATSFLAPGGRLGLVLPAELMFVNYAAPVRRLLLESFAEVHLAVFEERLFDDAQEEVVLLLASGYHAGHSTSLQLHQLRNTADLASCGAGTSISHQPASLDERWTSSLVGLEARGIHDAALAGGLFSPLQAWGETSLGAVTGNNKWFAISPQQAQALGLEASELVRISPPGSRHLRGLEFTTQQWEAMGAQGASAYMFRPPAAPSEAARQLIARGELAGVDQAYKCRVRTPWWRVPLVSVPDLFMTYMNADTPRLTANQAAARHINSIHGVYLGADVRELGSELLPLAALNSLSMLGAEMVGRSYGGGILKLEPKEADKWPVPSISQVQAHAPALRAIKDQVREHLSRGRKDEAIALVDQVVLAGMLELDQPAIQVVREARTVMHERRKARGRTVRK